MLFLGHSVHAISYNGLLTKIRGDVVSWFLLDFYGLQLAVVNVDRQKVVSGKNIELWFTSRKYVAVRIMYKNAKSCPILSKSHDP